MKIHITTKGQEILNLKRRKREVMTELIELAAHTQILKQQKQLNGRTFHIPLNINTEC
jgi:hypothetical protein